MGSFAGQLELSIIGHSAHTSGQLTLTFARPPEGRPVTWLV
jgi:hypothetical protein